MRRLHKQKTRIQSLENELKKARAEGNPFTPIQSISVPPWAAPSISITPIDTEDETLGTNIQLSTTPSHLTLTITTPTSSSVSISHGNGVSLTLGQRDWNSAPGIAKTRSTSLLSSLQLPSKLTLQPPLPLLFRLPLGLPLQLPFQLLLRLPTQ